MKVAFAAAAFYAAHGRGFWGSRAEQKVPWQSLVSMSRAATLLRQQVGVEKERGEEDGTRLVRRVAVGERLAEPGAGVDDPVVLDAGMLVVGKGRIHGRQAAQERGREQQAECEALKQPPVIAQRGSGRIWGTFLM